MNRVVSSLSILLGGVFYPLSVLPGWQQALARLLPITWSLDRIRGALLRAQGYAALADDLLALALIDLVLLPLGLFLFRLAVNHARRVGSLMKY